MARRLSPEELNRIAREEDQRVLASWHRITEQRTQNLPGSTRYARAAQDER